MKYSLALILPIFLMASSCSKNYTCKCDGAALHLEASTKYILKSKAEKWCKSLQNANTPTCKLI